MPEPETFELLPRFIFPRFSLLLSAGTWGKILVKKKKRKGKGRKKKKKKKSIDSIFKLANDDTFFTLSSCLSNFNYNLAIIYFAFLLLLSFKHPLKHAWFIAIFRIDLLWIPPAIREREMFSFQEEITNSWISQMRFESRRFQSVYDNFIIRVP